MIKTPQFWRHLMFLGAAMALLFVCIYSPNITLHLNVFLSICTHTQTRTHTHQCLSVFHVLHSSSFPLCIIIYPFQMYFFNQLISSTEYILHAITTIIVVIGWLHYYQKLKIIFHRRQHQPKKKTQNS